MTSRSIPCREHVAGVRKENGRHGAERQAEANLAHERPERELGRARVTEARAEAEILAAVADAEASKDAIRARLVEARLSGMPPTSARVNPKSTEM